MKTIQDITTALTNYFSQLEANGTKLKDFSPATRALLKVKRCMDNDLETLEKFKANLAKDPAYAFEWSGGAMDAAARIRILCQFIGSTNAETGPLPFTRTPEALDYMLKETTRSLLCNRYRGESTSSTHNAMEASARAAASWFVEDFTGYAEEIKKLAAK